MPEKPPEKPPLVYCIVLNLNGSAVLDDALASIFKMRYANFRVLLVDNGSQDDSIAGIQQKFPAVEIIENGQNLGFGGGNNVGMHHALNRGADWIFLLNNDIVVDQYLLSELMKFAVSDTTIGGLGGKIYYHDEPRKIWFGGGSVNFFTGLTNHRYLRQVDNGQADEISSSDYLTGCAFLIRAAALRRVGLFDEAFFPSYVEDADLSLRLRLAGYKLLYVPSGKLWHKVSSFSGGGLTPLKTKLRTAHSLIFFSRYARWYHWMTMPLFILTGSLIFIIRELLKGRFDLVKALLQGFILGVKKFHRTGKKQE